MSDLILNSYPTPNAIVDRIMWLLTDGELRVLIYTLRHILGWQQKRAKLVATISISNFVNGFDYTDDDGIYHKYNGCGLKEAAVRNALKGLEKYGVLKQVGEVNQHGRDWELAFMKTGKVDYAGLEMRISNKDNRDKKKMEAARDANPLLNTPPVEQEYPPSVEQDDGGSVEQDTTKAIVKSNVKSQVSGASAAHIEEKTNTTGKTSKPRKEDRIFNGIAFTAFDIDTRQEDYQHLIDSSKSGGRIGKISSALKKAFPDVTPEDIFAFFKHYKAKFPNADMPRDVDKYLEHFTSFRAQAPKQAPVIVYANNTSTLAQAALSEDERAAALATFKAGRLQKASGE